MNLTSKPSFTTIFILAVGLSAAVNAQALAKRDFSAAEKIAGVPKICIQEILQFNINADCVKLVCTESHLGHQ